MHVWKEHTLQVNGHEMAWFEIGAGPTLVCLHGSLDHLLYRPMGELFAQKYRCILYDQRGSGQSKLLESGKDAMDIKKFTQDLDALRDHLGLDQMALLGHSWGSGLGLLYAKEYPDRLSHLILVGPGPLNSEMRTVIARIEIGWHTRPRLKNLQLSGGHTTKQEPRGVGSHVKLTKP